MSQSKIINLLNNLISQEEKKLIDSCPADNASKKAVLYSLVRGFDTYHLFTKDKDKYVHHYEFGWLKALQLAYGDYVNEQQYPLFRAEEKLLRFVHWFTIRSGETEFCRKVIDFIKAGLGTATVKDKKITVEFRNIGVKEEFDNESFHWVHDMVHQTVSEPEIKKNLEDIERIRKTMRGLVKKWRDHYIQYDTTEEIDNAFEKFAYYRLLSSEAKEDFSRDALFGGIPYHKYCEFVMVTCGVALKHYFFCLELYEKYKGEINFPDIITITRGRMDLIRSMSRYLDISDNNTEQILDTITLSPENIEYHSGRMRSAPPPYIKIADNSLLHSVVGSQVNPYDFLNCEIRRRYEKDYFNAVNDREKTFRNQLYTFFEEDNYIKVDRNISFDSSKGASDIDAVVYDKNVNVLGLFQLKWQERFGASLKERYSRIANLYPKTKEWIDKVESWIRESDTKSGMRKFGIDYSSEAPVKVLFFVVCRYGTFFTGLEPDDRATWSSIWQMVKIFSQIPRNVPNKLEVLHNLLYREYLSLSDRPKKPDEESFNIGDYEICLKSVW